jgi:hypothetical protein
MEETSAGGDMTIREGAPQRAAGAEVPAGRNLFLAEKEGSAIVNAA